MIEQGPTTPWTELRALFQDHWQRLDDDDLAQVERDRNALPGILQRRYGLALDAAEHQVHAFLDAHTQPAPGASTDAPAQPSPWENPKRVPAGQLEAGGAPGDPQRADPPPAC